MNVFNTVDGKTIITLFYKPGVATFKNGHYKQDCI